MPFYQTQKSANENTHIQPVTSEEAAPDLHRRSSDHCVLAPLSWFASMMRHYATKRGTYNHQCESKPVPLPDANLLAWWAETIRNQFHPHLHKDDSRKGDFPNFPVAFLWWSIISNPLPSLTALKNPRKKSMYMCLWTEVRAPPSWSPTVCIQPALRMNNTTACQALCWGETITALTARCLSLSEWKSPTPLKKAASRTPAMLPSDAK